MKRNNIILLLYTDKYKQKYCVYYGGMEELKKDWRLMKKVNKELKKQAIIDLTNIDIIESNY